MHSSAPSPSPRHPADDAELFREFALTDKDRDGRIDFDEFKRLVQELDESMTDQDAHIGFHEVDTDRDGAVDRREFMAWWRED